jgi:hypothetical protein
MSLTSDTGDLFLKGSIGSGSVRVEGTAYLNGVDCTNLTASGSSLLGDLSASSVASSGAVSGATGSFTTSLTVSGTTTFDAPLLPYGGTYDIGRFHDRSVTPDDSMLTWNDIHLLGGVRLHGTDPGYFVHVDYLNNDVYGYGQWSGGASRAVISGSNASATFNISKPIDGTSFTDMVTVTQSGNMGVGVTPAYKLDVAGMVHATGTAQFDDIVTVGKTTASTQGNLYIRGGTASTQLISSGTDGHTYLQHARSFKVLAINNTTAQFQVASNGSTTCEAFNCSNTVVSGTITAGTYAGLQKKFWNANNLGFNNTDTTVKYHKVDTLSGTNNGALGGSVHVTGTVGGWLNNQTTKVDIIISNRVGLVVAGTGYGFVSNTKALNDIAVYWEGSDLSLSNWSFYIVSKAQFQAWDLTALASEVNIVLAEPSATYVTAPTGTAVCSSVLSQLTQSTEFGSGTAMASFNNTFQYSYAGGVWTLQGSSNAGTVLCGALTSSGAFSLGPTSGTAPAPAGPYKVSMGYDAVGTSHSIGSPPAAYQNSCRVLHIYAKNKSVTYRGNKTGYLRLFYHSGSGKTNITYTKFDDQKVGMTTMTVAVSFMGFTVTTDSDCCVCYTYEGAC